MPRKKTKRTRVSRKAAKPSKSGIRIVARAKLPTRFGPFEILGIEGKTEQESAVALIRGKIRGEIPLVRIHSQCFTGDTLASERCDCRAQLELSLRKIADAPSGVLLYLPQEGRGIGLMNKLRAYSALPPIRAITDFPPKPCVCWACAACDCFPTIRIKCGNSKNPESKLWNACHAAREPLALRALIWKPSAPSSAIYSIVCNRT
jgi:ribosomal protein S12